MKNKCFSLIMTLIMAIAMMPTITFTSYATENTMSFTEFQQLLSAKKTTSITLESDIIATPGEQSIVVTGDATVNLNGHTINRNLSGKTAVESGEVFSVSENAKLTLRKGTITGGNNKGFGGAIYNQGNLSVIDCDLIENQSGKSGGAIYNAGELLLRNSTIFNNKVTGTDYDGGGISNYGNIKLNGNVKIINNESAGRGGGLQVNDGEIEFSGKNIIIRGNVANSRDRNFCPNISKNKVKISSNLAGSQIYYCPVSDNASTTGIVTSGYLENNSEARVNSYFYYEGPSTLYPMLNNGEIEIAEVPDGQYSIKTTPAEGGAVITDKQIASAGATVNLSTVTDSLDYVLDTVTVETEGGQTVTVDGSSFVMPNDNVVVSATFKSGAQKLWYIDDAGYDTFAEAIAACEDQSVSENANHTIKLLSNTTITEPILIPSGKNVIINLNGKTLSGSGSNRLINVSENARLEIKGSGTIQNGTAESGGAIYNEGILIISGGTITNCSATKNGGAIYSNNKLTIQGGTINNCSAKDGGAIFNDGRKEFGGKALDTVFEMTGGKIENCIANVNSEISKLSSEAVHLCNSQFDMSGGEIIGNIFTNDIISDNNPHSCVVYFAEDCSEKLDGMFISNHNLAASDTEESLMDIRGGFFSHPIANYLNYNNFEQIANIDDVYKYKVVAKQLDTYSIEYYDGVSGNASAEPFTGTHEEGYPITYTSGTITSLKDAYKTGFVFGGWFLNKNCSGNAITAISGDSVGNISLYAKWDSIETYNISYRDINSNQWTGTFASEAPSKYYWDQTTILLSPSKLGYSFGGWYLDISCDGTRITELTKFKYDRDIVLYAKWEAQKYPVTFDKNFEGSELSSADAIVQTYDNNYILPDNPVRARYAFSGWYTASAEGQGEMISADSIVKITAPQTLYAHWAETTYTVTFDMQNHGNQINPITGIIYNDKIQKPNNPSADGYYFEGWFTTSEYSKEWNFAVDTVRTNTTLYAKWSAVVPYSITYRDKGSNNFSGNNLNELPQNHTRGIKTTLVDAKRDGYAFGGWYLDRNCTGDAITELSADGYKSEITLYAKWTAKKYNVTFDKQGGTGGSATAEPTFDEDMPDVTVPSREGFTFDGYYSAASGGAQYYYHDGQSANKWNIPEDTTLYAHWVGFTNDIEYKDAGADEFSGNLSDGTPAQHTNGVATTLGSATRDGYDFAGWYLTSGCQGQAITEISAAAVYLENTVITLYAKWTAKTYAVTFVGNYPGSDYSVELNETYLEKYALPSSEPARNGYVFDGWYTDDEHGYEISANSDVTITENTTLYAHWKFGQLTVTFNGNGHGTAPNPTTVVVTAEGTRIRESSVDPVIGYDLVGWYRNSECTGNAWNFNDAVTENMTLYAKWEAQTYDVTFDCNMDYEHTNETITQTYGEKYIIPSAEPIYPGHNFVGWFTLEEGGDQISSDSDFQKTSNQTVFAHWTVKTYTITYNNLFDGVLSAESPSTHKFGEETLLKDASRTGYEFLGWYIEQTCSDNSRVDSLGANAFTDNINLYAKWKANTYNIIYLNQNGVAWSGAESFEFGHPETHTYGTKTVLKNAYRENQGFAGWYLDISCNGPRIYELSANGYTADITLYAKWQDTFTVRFDANGHGTAPNEITGITSGATISKPSPDPSANGYQFAGWYTDSQGGGDPFNFNQPINRDYVLYAKWTALTCNVTFNYNYDGAPSADSIEQAYGSKYVLPNEPTREHYTFDGWFTESSGGAKVTADTQVQRLDSHSLYAHWTEKAKYTVTFDANGHGTAPAAISNVYAGEKISKPTDPTESGWKFGGWYETSACAGTAWNFSTDTVTKNTTLYAKWTEDSGGGGGGGGGSGGGGGEEEPDPQKELAEAKVKANTAIDKEAGIVLNRSEDVARLVNDANAAIQAATSKEQLATIQEKYVGAIKVAIATNAVVSVQNKAVAQKSGKMKLSFKRLLLADGTKVTKYEIYRKDPGKKTYKKLKTLTYTKSAKNINYTDSKKLKKGKKYSYKIRGIVPLVDGSYAHTQWSKTKTIKCKKTRK